MACYCKELLHINCFTVVFVFPPWPESPDPVTIHKQPKIIICVSCFLMKFIIKWRLNTETSGSLVRSVSAVQQQQQQQRRRWQDVASHCCFPGYCITLCKLDQQQTGPDMICDPPSGGGNKQPRWKQLNFFYRQWRVMSMLMSICHIPTIPVKTRFFPLAVCVAQCHAAVGLMPGLDWQHCLLLLNWRGLLV